MSIFTKIEKTKVGSNTFDLTHDKKLSCKMGQLVPFLCLDTVPGDKIDLSASTMVRMAPLIAPIMHQVSCYMHYFFVPHRLIWPNWEKFITGGEDGEDTTVWPYMDVSLGFTANGSLNDYLGLPVDNSEEAATPSVSAMPLATYLKIWYDYYRDQNLQTTILPEEIILSDGDNSTFGEQFGENPPLMRAWQHDYFTSALPWTQKGPSATIPLGTDAPLIYNDTIGYQVIRDAAGNLASTSAFTSDSGGVPPGALIDDNTLQARLVDISGTHVADLSAATAATITDLRRAFKLQEWLEKNARGGSRYIESIAVHFGVQSSDKRLQRPEFLGGYRMPVKISEVLQTSETTIDSPQANMSGHAVALGGMKKTSYYCEEHGYIMGIMSILPKSAYQQGIPRHYLRRDKFDYYWPEFAHIGEQAVENQELYWRAGDPEAAFGYNPRYSEYKYIPSTVHGDFRDTLDFWHMGRKFSSTPQLNDDFIECDYTEFDRIFAVQDESDHLWCHVLNQISAKRKMPYFGNPKM